MISISINRMEIQLKEIVKLKKSHYMLKTQHLLLALHKFYIEASRNVSVRVCGANPDFLWTPLVFRRQQKAYLTRQCHYWGVVLYH